MIPIDTKPLLMTFEQRHYFIKKSHREPITPRKWRNNQSLFNSLVFYHTNQ